MRDRNANGLELRWVEVRDERGTHMEARWAQAAAAPVAATPAPAAVAPAPHAA